VAGSRALVLLLLAGCTAHQPEEDTPSSPLHAACRGEVRQMQSTCNPDLLRTQGGDCAAAASHVNDHCSQAR
jgi:hypothetical protein